MKSPFSLYIGSLKSALQGDLEKAQYLYTEAEKIKESLGLDFSESAVDEFPFIEEALTTLLSSYDFTRCVRPDGSVYGTRGKCRRGTEASAPEKSKEEDKARPGGRDLAALDKKWEQERLKTYNSLKGRSKQELLDILSQHRKIHGMSIKDSIRDLKGGILGAIYGNDSPSEKAEKTELRRQWLNRKRAARNNENP